MDIDFVIPWVDGSDLEWRKNKNKYSGKIDEPVDITDARYRDWDILKYWFRGVEKYAPWVHKIYFVTCGQKPDWLNENHDKLVLVNHEDYIPHEYLPTFSSHTIELNFHRIKNLSEHFVYFNDDVFITSKVEPEDFFKNGLPCDMAVEDPISPNKQDVFMHILLNNMILLNSKYDRKEVLKKQRKKFYLVKDKKALMMNWSFWLWRRHDFFGLEYSHLSSSYLKSTYEQVWRENEQILDRVCRNKFRSAEDVNQYIFKNEQLVTGRVSPYNWRKNGKAFHMNDGDSEDNNITDMCHAIENGIYKMICVNESQVENYEETKQKVVHAFEKILPCKSLFEK